MEASEVSAIFEALIAAKQAYDAFQPKEKVPTPPPQHIVIDQEPPVVNIPTTVNNKNMQDYPTQNSKTDNLQEAYSNVLKPQNLLYKNI